MICSLANTLWTAACVPELRRFTRATSRVGEVQRQQLRQLLEANRDTEFGRDHGFATIRSPREYQQRVSLSSYEDYRPWIDRIATGSPHVLTHDPVTLFEPTSGSTTATKLIPYTASLQREFQRGIRPWIADLFLHRPALAGGAAYWSVSPAIEPGRTSGGIPIGFDEDSAYVGGWQRKLVQAVMAVPAEVRRERTMERFRHRTLLSLVRCSHLRLVSVWNPTFFLLLMDRLPEIGDELIRELRAPRELRKVRDTQPRRADVLAAALRARTAAERHTILWPRLRVISCWTDGHAADPARELASQFPQAEMQGKGLIATEGFVSLPFVGQAGSSGSSGSSGSCLALRSHFFEFVPVDTHGSVSDGDGDVRLAEELERGQRYAVVLSTGGGLYRYQLNDIVEVTGHRRECPVIRFIGRQAHISDWFGEKLNELHVAQVLRDAFAAASLSPSFAMMACDPTLTTPAYVLYLETTDTNESLGRLARQIDTALRQSVHYEYARRLGQLGPLRIFRTRGASERYLAAEVHEGRRAGDIKPLALHHRSGWTQVMTGDFVPMADDVLSYEQPITR
jgi:GH3 auxin-responsive promoter